MMKKVILVCVLLFISVNARSQILISLIFGEALNSGSVEFGLDGGVNLASMSGSPDPKMNTLFNLGFYFDIKLGDPSWMLHTGVIVKSTMGTANSPVYQLHDAILDSAFKGGSVTTDLSYFNVPIMLKYRMPNRFFVEGGIMAGLLYNAYDNFINTMGEDGNLTYERKVKNEYHPLDFGLIAGIGYRLMGEDEMNLGIRYYYGLIDVYIDDSGSSRMNRSLYFTLGIPIGAQSKTEDDSK
jgi:hypothetical protein